MVCWIDTHCHLDAAEFASDARAVRARASAGGVAHCVIPAVAVSNFNEVRALAHAGPDSYALGIHPLCVKEARDEDLDRLDAALREHRDDPKLVAVGEIGLDFFVPEFCTGTLRERQQTYYLAQLRLARKHHLPVLLHVRRSVDQVIHGLRTVAAESDGDPWRGIAHAFNGSAQQAQAMMSQGLKLGFGGALTYQRASRLRALAASLPLDAIVMETDAPDMPPHWLYQSAERRAGGQRQGRNEPGELPRIGAELAALRAIPADQFAQATTGNAVAALPRLAVLLGPEVATLATVAKGSPQFTGE